MRRALVLSALLHGLLLLALARLDFGPAEPTPPLVVELVAASDLPVDEPEAPPADPVATAPEPPREEAAPPPAPTPQPAPEDIPEPRPVPSPPAAEPAPEPPSTEPEVLPPASPEPAPPPDDAPPTPDDAAAPPAPAEAAAVPDDAAEDSPASAPAPAAPRPKPPPDARPSPPQRLARLHPTPRPAPPAERRRTAVPTPPRPPVAKPRPAPRPEVAARTDPAGERADVQAEDAFDTLLRSVERLERRERAQARREGRGRSLEAGAAPRRDQGVREQVGPAQLALLQRLVEEQVYRCWSIPLAARGLREMRVLVRFELTPDGRVVRAEIVDQARFARDPVFRIVAESAIRAVHRCAPLRLPRELYAAWRTIEMNFDLGRALSG